ncbi:RES domain-containing protein [Draconibacterium mangrovi]|uniref:RES domain-containing protein n=1 Tax=Draconibacterium mangrovi TaxID=2697469 RepID=UPI0013D02F8C|nr:RES domain-containing protein [Draconibacterium mangrovi]
MTNKIELPKIENVKKGIDELLLIEKWDNYKVKSSPKKFEKRFHQLFTQKLGIFPHILKIMKSEDFTFPFYRLRKETGSMNKTLISEYSYPPNNVIKNIQRANIPYHPVFYCADSPMTAIVETIRNEKNINPKHNYYLSRWDLKPGLDFRVTPFLFGNLADTSIYKTLSDDNLNQIEETLKGYSIDEINGMKKILEFLSHLFIYDNSYVVSSFIAHSYIYAKHNLRTDIFIYPSHQSDRQSVNFALHPNVVTEKLNLTKVYKLNIVDLPMDNNSCTVKVSMIGKNQDSIIYWNNVADDNKLDVEELFK